ncbi:MAG: glycosyltransferase [Chthoniobacteraceae bacterium]
MKTKNALQETKQKQPILSSYAGSHSDIVMATEPSRYAGTACVITSHNYGRFLAQCIESCLNQSVPFESIVVVDDASDDDTAAVAQQFAARGVRYVRGEWRNFGSARMRGLAASPRTPFLLFVDADNSLSRTYHEQLRTEMTGSNIGAVYGNLLHFDESGTLGLSPSVQPFDRDHLRRRNLADACSLVRREAFEQVGGWRKDSFLTDWMMWLDLTRHGWEMRQVPGAILNYRIHRAQMSNIREGNVDIHVAPLRQSCMIAVLTLFSGRRWALDRHFEWLDRLDWNRDNLHLVALDNSNDPEFSRALKQRLADCGLAFSYVADRAQALPEVEAADFAASREQRSQHSYALAAHLARLYAVARQHVPGGADFVWSVEDDIEPPAHALHHLCKGLFRHPKAGAVTGCARSRFEDQWILWQGGTALSEPPSPGDYLPVDATGFYCTLMRRPVFDAIAFRPTRDWSLKNCAYDWAAVHDIIQSGSQVLASADVRCKHWQPDGSWV